MKLIDRYIARLYLINIATLFVLLFSFVLTIDVVMNLGRFTKHAARISDGGSTIERLIATVAIIADLWGPRFLQLFAYLSGTVMIAAMGFTCVQLVRHREFVALLASGVSLHRLVRPFLLVAAVVVGAQIIDQEVLIPRVAHLVTRDISSLDEDRAAGYRLSLISDGAGGLLSAQRFLPDSGELVKPHYWQRDSQGNVLRAVSAQRATWNGAGWTLVGGREFIPTGGAGVTRPAETLATPLDPERIELSHLQSLGQNLSWAQISDIIERGGIDPKAEARLERVRWGRIASVLSNFLALLATLPFFLVRLPQPMLGAALKAAPVAVLGLAAAGFASAPSLPGIPVWLGAFLPAMLLLPVAVALFTGIRS